MSKMSKKWIIGVLSRGRRSEVSHRCTVHRRRTTWGYSWIYGQETGLYSKVIHGCAIHRPHVQQSKVIRRRTSQRKVNRKLSITMYPVFRTIGSQVNQQHVQSSKCLFVRSNYAGQDSRDRCQRRTRDAQFYSSRALWTVVPQRGYVIHWVPWCRTDLACEIRTWRALCFVFLHNFFLESSVLIFHEHRSMTQPAFCAFLRNKCSFRDLICPFRN